MNKYKIQFSKYAKKDLIDIYSYIKYNLHEPIIAKKIISKIREEIYKIKDNPILYALVKDEILKKRQIRKVKVNNYIIFYKINENNHIVEIIRIMHIRRNWISIL